MDCLKILAIVINEFVRGGKRERNSSRGKRSDGSRRTIVGISKEWIACMHARDGRRYRLRMRI